MKVQAITQWGCPCTVTLDAEGRYESALDHFGTALRRDQVKVSELLEAREAVLVTC